nr:MAG TPA: hypothetical protein [Caudoviricetes sp.]
MRTLRYTENEYVEATKNIWRKLPDEFKVFNMPRDEEGYIIGGIVDEDSTVEPGAVVVGSNIKGSNIEEGAIVIGSTINASYVGVESFVLCSELDHSTVYRETKIENSWLRKSTVDRYTPVTGSVLEKTLVIGATSRITRSFLSECELYRTRLDKTLATNSKIGSLQQPDENFTVFTNCVMAYASITCMDDETRHIQGAFQALITPKTPVRAAEISLDSTLTFFNRLDGSAAIDFAYARNPLPLHATAEATQQLGTLNWGRSFVEQQYELINEATNGLAQEIPGTLIDIDGVTTAIELLDEMKEAFQ